MMLRPANVFIVTLYLLVARLLCVDPVIAVTGEPNFQAILEKHGAQLATVTSDDEAKSFFMAHLLSIFGLKENPPDARRKRHNRLAAGSLTQSSFVPEIDELTVRFTADLASWQLSILMKRAADTDDPARLSTIIEQTMLQQTWLFVDTQRNSLRRVFHLASVLSSFPAERTPLNTGAYPDYAAYLDKRYPRLSGPYNSWLSTAEQDGRRGIRQRLLEFWAEPAAGEHARAEEDEREALALNYFQNRLRPVFTAHLVAMAIHAETDAEQRTRNEWVRFQTSQETQNEKHGLTRLCGMWQWTIHNHQNHQDYKMMLAFPASDATGSTTPRPTKIVVLGDGVYLRWELQSGLQEDSLLFTGEGRRLEGTFTNSAGAWGSITGKRIAPCGKS